MKKILENDFAMSQHLLSNPAVLNQSNWKKKVLKDQYLKQRMEIARLNLAQKLYDEISKEEKACLVKILPPEIEKKMPIDCCTAILYIRLKVYYSNEY